MSKSSDLKQVPDSTKNLTAHGLLTDVIGIMRQRDVSFPVEISTLEFFMLTVYGQDVTDKIEEAVRHSEVLELQESEIHDVGDVDYSIDHARDKTKWNRRKVARSEKCNNCDRVVGEGDWLYKNEDKQEFWCETCTKKKAMTDNLENFTVS